MTLVVMIVTTAWLATPVSPAASAPVAIFGTWPVAVTSQRKIFSCALMRTVKLASSSAVSCKSASFGEQNGIQRTRGQSAHY